MDPSDNPNSFPTLALKARKKVILFFHSGQTPMLSSPELARTGLEEASHNDIRNTRCSRPL
jgi:hypothetical protein